MTVKRIQIVSLNVHKRFSRLVIILASHLFGLLFLLWHYEICHRVVKISPIKGFVRDGESIRLLSHYIDGRSVPLWVVNIPFLMSDQNVAASVSHSLFLLGLLILILKPSKHSAKQIVSDLFNKHLFMHSGRSVCCQLLHGCSDRFDRLSGEVSVSVSSSNSLRLVKYPQIIFLNCFELFLILSHSLACLLCEDVGVIKHKVLIFNEVVSDES